ncbi:MAG: hypothetical protein Q9M37_09915 [Desulfonauticus sp.]|nr:hypothetical protein [Desulfonauticus sp.]
MSFRPDRYEVKYWGFEHSFKFPVVKLLDYRDKLAALEASKNPFAIVVMAHLKEIETRKEIDNRLFWKLILVKALYKKGFSKRDILLLYKFIDCLVTLPEDISVKFHEEIIKYEEETKMPYITTAERIGLEKGLHQGIQKGIQQGLLKAIEIGLKLKFGIEGLKLYSEIKKIQDVDLLETITEAIETAEHVSDIRELMDVSVNGSSVKR